MVQRYYRELLNFCLRAVQNRETAADLAQESYVRVLSLQQAGSAVPEPRALLYTTARNLLVDRHRRNAVRGEHLQANGDEDPLAALTAPRASEPDVAAASTQTVNTLLATIDALPLRCREAFILHKFDGLSHTEVAERMGISRKMVEQHMKLALTACRQCIDAPSATTQPPKKRGPGDA